MARNASTLQRVPLGPVIGVMFGIAAAVLVAATPDWLFEQTVVSLGLATPPVGSIARFFAILMAFAVVGLIVWGFVRTAERVFAEPVDHEPDASELDLATCPDALPVAPRRPISADRELGAPLMSDEALQTVAPVAEGAETEAESPVSPVSETVETVQRATGYTSIEELIRRLEIGMARRGGPRPPDPGGAAAVPPLPATGSSWIVREDEAENPGESSERMAAA